MSGTAPRAGYAFAYGAVAAGGVVLFVLSGQAGYLAYAVMVSTVTNLLARDASRPATRHGRARGAGSSATRRMSAFQMSTGDRR